MAQNDSFPTKALLSTSRLAKQEAPSSTVSHCGLKAMCPGCSTTHTPRNPASVANQRRGPTRSFRMRLERTRVNRGIVKLRVVTTAIGAMVRPVQYSAMPAASSMLRAKCSVSLLVRNESRPEANMTGSMERVANEKRRKTIWATARSPPAYFMMTSLPTPMSWWAMNQPTPSRNLSWFESALSTPPTAAMAHALSLFLPVLWTSSAFAIACFLFKCLNPSRSPPVLITAQ
mmetsp:Transcript_40504/g.67651  ORF Transcript_40504/g.67651 Transcript_40504/m.67651 type:complete len:231 (-) Transcript_40504:402-1094(-)